MKTGCDLKVELDFWVSQCNLSKTTSPMTFIDVCFGFVSDWSPIFHQSLTTTIPLTLNSTQIGWTGNKRSFKGGMTIVFVQFIPPSWHQCTDSICPDSLTAVHTNDGLILVDTLDANNFRYHHHWKSSLDSTLPSQYYTNICQFNQYVYKYGVGIAV